MKLSNLKMLEFAANKLGSLCCDVVFLGGCTTALLIDDRASPDVRTTTDVDCIIDVISRCDYHKFEEKLRRQGFKNSVSDGVICRWIIDDLKLDVMPTDKTILGFNNNWYKSAIKNYFTHTFSNNVRIKVISAPYFLATKIEAFKQRGQLDFLSSHDFEDIIAVIDGRLNLVEEVNNSNEALRKYLAQEFNTFNNSRAFHDALPGHMTQYRKLAEERIDWLLEKMLKMTKG